jgi:hypothetical protein
MPSASFDEIALEYARQFAHIDYARREYHRQRDRLLSDLERTLATTIGRSDLPLETIVIEADKTHRTAPLLRHYHRVVTKKIDKDRPRRDGVWFGISTGAVRSEEDAEVCFRADVYFGMGSPAYGRLTASLLEIEQHATEKLEGVPVDDEPLRLRYTGGWLYIPVARIPATADTFTRSRFESIVSSLPERFVHYDEVLAKAYTEAWDLEPTMA